MAGGIIQIATYGSEDIYLTGNPQITFFRAIYRRYTNFSCEDVYQPFNGETAFGGSLNCVLDKLGDLIHRMTLVIDLPKVNLIKIKEDARQKVDDIQKKAAIDEFYKILNNYFAITVQKVRDLLSMLSVSNISFATILATINDPNWRLLIEIAYAEVADWIATDPRFSYFGLDRWDSLENLKITNLLLQLSTNINLQWRKNCKYEYDETVYLVREYLIKFLKYEYYSFLRDFQTAFAIIYYQNYSGPERYSFAWVDRVGQAIIEQISFYLGAELIDRQTGEFVILWTDLTLLPPQKINFDKMIGNIPELNTFDDKEKPQYRLYVPLNFYFNRHIGLALPAIALSYDDIIIDFRVRKFNEVAYADVPWADSLEEVQDYYKIQLLNVSLLVEYIFLDRPERIRFAQSTHEYLIETTQYNIIHASGPNPFIRLDMNNPSKFLAWFIQPLSYRINYDGRTKCQWDNFGTKPDGSGQTLERCWIRLNSLDRTDNTLDSTYFNWVQPYQCFWVTPRSGLYTYSFALYPLDHQPSSTCNFSRINQLGIQLEFTKEILNFHEPLYFAAYTMSYNILRIMGGRSALAYRQDI